MKCKICGNDNPSIVYNGIIRDGAINQYTKESVIMYQCSDCGVIWHEVLKKTADYYESEEYRTSLDGSALETDFYNIYDKETFDKLRYTGTEIYRGKIVCDIGCGAGAFLDYVHGGAKKTIAIEPSSAFRSVLERKGFITYDYAQSAYAEWKNKIDVITSFDVIEHVEDPESFIRDYYNLLSKGGVGVIGTPTDAPVMRSLLGEIYERKLLFSTQHIWILCEKSMRIMAEKAGFKEPDIEFKYYQRYGLGNCLGWLKEKRARSTLTDRFITPTMDAVWKKELESIGLSDYIVMYLRK